MATNLAIDDALIDEAREIGGERTKKAVVTQALLEYIQRRQQSKVLGLFGKVVYDDAYDHTAQRKLKKHRGSSEATFVCTSAC